MLWTIGLIFTILWLQGLVTGHTMGYPFHIPIPLFLAIIAVLVQIEDDWRMKMENEHE